ncbi:SH3 domain-containing YSC84-like protein 1 [Phytophthora boehmeriae]|uniref:SH3 domain-containing YSC84-like protein 1 n=1 Tax=Phytophthora boehmeriae TaxID=109152 RepID=A0A8T1WLU4_9STRA|nr:SH3 domain-containing YSC84-like protein 1 [Phytophthora boehmeriae]
MEFMGSVQFPSLTPRISELYGASGGVFRVGEADSYASDLDELEREELALETMVQGLVNRQAAAPIGLKFHREDARTSLQPTGESFESGAVAQDAEIPFMQSSSEEEEEDEEEEEEEEEMMIEEEEEEETNQRATIVRGTGPPPLEEDSFDEGSAEDLMDMDMELPLPTDWN